MSTGIILQFTQTLLAILLAPGGMLADDMVFRTLTSDGVPRVLDDAESAFVRSNGIALAGYAALQLVGVRYGAAFVGVFGGLASSTATTLAFAKRSKEDPGLSNHYAMAVVTACSMMLPRVVIAGRRSSLMAPNSATPSEARRA